MSDSADSLVHLRVSRELKNSWVRQSQSVGSKLTDWVIRMVAVGSNPSAFSAPKPHAPALQGNLSVSQLRHLAGLTQEELAASLGVSKSTVEKWEGGSVTPKTASLELLMLLAGQHPDYVLVDRS